MFGDVSYLLCLHKLVSRVSFLLYIPADVKTLSLSVFGYVFGYVFIYSQQIYVYLLIVIFSM